MCTTTLLQAPRSESKPNMPFWTAKSGTLLRTRCSTVGPKRGHAVAMLLASAPRIEGTPPKPPAPACVNGKHRSALTRLSARPALLLPCPLRRTRAPERVCHGQAERSSSPLLLPPLRPSSVRTKLGITFSSFRRPFLRPYLAVQPAGAPSVARPRWMVHARTWLGHLGSSQAEQVSPMGPLCSLGAPPPLLHRR